jgi:hypothetical protein
MEPRLQLLAFGLNGELCQCKLNLRLIYTRDVGMAFSMSGAILIEKFLASQNASARGSDKYLLFSRMYKRSLMKESKLFP